MVLLSLKESIEGHLCFNAPRLKWRKNYGSKSESFKVARTGRSMSKANICDCLMKKLLLKTIQSSQEDFCARIF